MLVVRVSLAAKLTLLCLGTTEHMSVHILDTFVATGGDGGPKAGAPSAGLNSVSV